jgi:hypothetical protein
MQSHQKPLHRMPVSKGGSDSNECCDPSAQGMNENARSGKAGAGVVSSVGERLGDLQHDDREGK